MLLSTFSEPRIPERKPNPWGAFLYRDFRLLMFGQLVSQLGTWMQFTSLTYLLGVVLATGEAQSAINLAILGASQAISALSLSPIAGVVADRYPRRRTLIIVALVRAGFALALAFVSFGKGPWVLPLAILFAACGTGAQSFDPPARQSWVSFIVPRPLLSNAIGFGALVQNAPLTIGPAIAGFLIGTSGVYASFIVNAVAQCGVLIAVWMMRPVAVSMTSRESMIKEIGTAVRFLATHNILRLLVVMLIVSCLCVRPYNQLLATFAGHVLHVDAKAYGTMLAVGGLGTVGGAVVTAMYGSERRGILWFASGVVMSVVLAVLGYTHNYLLVLLWLTLIGAGAMAFTSSTNVLMQTISPDDMRGRTLSLYSMIILGLVPGGTLLMGSLGSIISLPPAYAIGGAIALVSVIWIWIANPAIRTV